MFRVGAEIQRQAKSSSEYGRQIDHQPEVRQTEKYSEPVGRASDSMMAPT